MRHTYWSPPLNTARIAPACGRLRSSSSRSGATGRSASRCVLSASSDGHLSRSMPPTRLAVTGLPMCRRTLGKVLLRSAARLSRCGRYAAGGGSGPPRSRLRKSARGQQAAEEPSGVEQTVDGAHQVAQQVPGPRTATMTSLNSCRVMVRPSGFRLSGCRSRLSTLHPSGINAERSAWRDHGSARGGDERALPGTTARRAPDRYLRIARAGQESCPASDILRLAPA